MEHKITNLVEVLTNNNLPEKMDFAIRHLLAILNNPNEKLCRLNTALELLESYKRDLEKEKHANPLYNETGICAG